MSTFEGLTKGQHQVFSQIATGNDRGHSPRTLKTLVDKGYISVIPVTLPGWPPVMVNRYEVPIDLHIRWCAWCADNPTCLICDKSLKGYHDTDYCADCIAQTLGVNQESEESNA